MSNSANPSPEGMDLVEKARIALIADIQERFNKLTPPESLTASRAEYWKAGARAAIAQVATALAKAKGATP